MEYDQTKDTITINGKFLLYAAAIILILLLFFSSFGGLFSKDPSSGSSSGIPERCQVPSGQDVEKWKEHLGHHAETRDCLKYFK